MERPPEPAPRILGHDLWGSSAELSCADLADSTRGLPYQGTGSIVRECQELVVTEAVVDTILIRRPAGSCETSEIQDDLHLPELSFDSAVTAVSCHERMSSRKIT